MEHLTSCRGFASGYLRANYLNLSGCDLWVGIYRSVFLPPGPLISGVSLRVVDWSSALAGNIIDAENAKTAMLLPAGCAIIGALLALSLLKLLNPTRSSHEACSGTGDG